MSGESYGVVGCDVLPAAIAGMVAGWVAGRREHRIQHSREPNACSLQLILDHGPPTSFCSIIAVSESAWKFVR